MEGTEMQRWFWVTMVFASSLVVQSCVDLKNDAPPSNELAAELAAASERLKIADQSEPEIDCSCQPLDAENISDMSLGLRLRVRPILHRLEHLGDALEDALTVPTELISLGSGAVPSQSDSWSCGVNSAARFAAMLGYPIKDYAHFLEHTPRYLGWGPFPKIGANPVGIQNYLRKHGNIPHLSIGQKCTKDFHSNWEIMIKSLQMGRPVLVLTMTHGTLMHWVNIVARHSKTQNWFIMNTNGEVYEIPGGDDEIKNWMSSGHCAAQRFKFIERFNTITTTRNN
jgi:hypothetical protein